MPCANTEPVLNLSKVWTRTKAKWSEGKFIHSFIQHLAGGSLNPLRGGVALFMTSQRNDSHPQKQLKVDFYNFLLRATETGNPLMQPNADEDEPGESQQPPNLSTNQSNQCRLF